MVQTAEINPHLKRMQETEVPLTDLDWLKEGAQFPPPSQEKRQDRYARNRELWKGDHPLVFGDWFRSLNLDHEHSIEITLNWFKRLSTLWADLQLSEPPRFLDGEQLDPEPKGPQEDGKEAPGDSGQDAKDERQDHIDRITGKDDARLVKELYKIAIDNSRYGNGLLKVSLEEDGAGFTALPPHYWFPVVDFNNMKKTLAHVLAWPFERSESGQRFLRVEVHRKGYIQHRVFHYGGNHLGTEANIEEFLPKNELGESSMPGGIEATGIEDDFLLIPFSALDVSDEIFGTDDYIDIESMIRAIELRCAQINLILDKHSDPSMYGPPEHLVKNEQGAWVFKASGQYIEVDEDSQIPGYIVWDGQLIAQFQEIETIIHQLYILSETSPAAFGQIESGLAESGSALRRLMQAPLAKVARLTNMGFDANTKRAIKLAAQLERVWGRGTPEIPAVNVQWQDGLPKDPKEQAEAEEIRLRSGNTSMAASIMRADGATKEEALAELEAIDQEARANQERDLEQTEKQAEIAAKHAPSEATKPTKPFQPAA